MIQAITEWCEIRTRKDIPGNGQQNENNQPKCWDNNKDRDNNPRVNNDNC